MRNGLIVKAIIPALNEAAAIGMVLQAIPDWVDEVVLADNGSTDETTQIADKMGARIVHESRRGYGSACLAGIAALGQADIVVFLDGDYSDYPEQMHRLTDPIAKGEFDFVVGSRVLGNAAPGALLPQARFGNWLATRLIALFWGARYTDLGPFRAIRRSTLHSLDMRDPDYGWTVEMQIKAAKRGVRASEVPVDYRKREGRSKISGTLRGVLAAGTKILWTIAREMLSPHGPPSRSLVVFCRYPESGKAKTRLIPALGADGAAGLHRMLAERTMSQVRRFLRLGTCHVHVCFEGGGEESMRDWLGADISYVPQGDGSLGDRMARAFSHDNDYTVIIGTDCPGLDETILRQAFEALAESDVVIGPADDGGYYLIGVRRRAWPQSQALFSGPDWGTETVLEATLQIAHKHSLSIRLLEPLPDIDRPEDLHLWEAAQDEPRHTPRFSVIIPALNEANAIAATISSLLRIPDVEVIVADGGSSDETAVLAAQQGAVVQVSAANRACRMNAAAGIAQGDYLVFLHADTRLPNGWDSEVIQALAFPVVTAGAFRVATNNPRLGMRSMARLVNLRAKWLQLPYGDQGLFMRRPTFHELGGFADIPIMEDYDMAKRLRRKGFVVISRLAAITSARRWQKLGLFRVFAINQLCILGYETGLSPDSIARYYRRFND